MKRALVLLGVILAGCGSNSSSPVPTDIYSDDAIGSDVADVAGDNGGRGMQDGKPGDAGDVGSVPRETTTDGDAVAPPTCPGLATILDQAYRVTHMAATEPTDQVNEVWEKDIKEYTLVMVFHVLEYDPATAKGLIEVTSCWADVEVTGEGKDKVYTPKSYQFALEPSEFAVTFDGCSFTIDDELELDIVTPSVSKPFHVFGLKGGGAFSADAKKIENIDLAGFIKEKETFDLCMMIPGLGSPSFHWFMNLAHICADADSDGDDKIDSYHFVGNLKAKLETSLFKDGIHPIQSLVEECLPDSKPCVPVK